MRQFINIGIGQAGIQISQSLLEIYAEQHSIHSDGKKKEEIQRNENSLEYDRKLEVLQCMFEENQKSQMKARFLMIDSQPDVIDNLAHNKYNNLLNPPYMISGKQSANTYPKGYYYSKSCQFDEIYQNHFKKVAQKCDNLEAFLINHGIQGGTGSGTASLIMQILSDTFPKVQRTNFLVNFYGPNSDTIIGPYNTVLGLENLNKFSDLVILVDNFSIHELFSRSLDVQSPNFKNLNSLISQVHSSYTLPSRFIDNKISCDISEIQTNLVAFPELLWVIPSFVPLISQNDLDKGWGNNFKPQQLISKCFDTSCQMANQRKILYGYPVYDDPHYNRAKKISSVLLGRGDIIENEFSGQKNSFIQKKLSSSLRQKIIKLGLSPHKATRIHLNQTNKRLRTSITSLTSSIQVGTLFCRANHGSNLLFSKKSFIHWFQKDGMEKSQIETAIQTVHNMIDTYDKFYESEFLGN